MELKVFFTLFVLGYIFSYFFRTKGQLACGLWGFCGTSAPDPNKLRLLCLFNLKRGEQATGFFADDFILKDTKAAPTFLAENYKHFEALAGIKNYIVIGHDRNASPGYSRDKIDQAHPHGIKDEDKYAFVLAHNGTLTNTYSLASHYKFEVGNQSDSQVLTKILSTVEETKIGEVLQQYEGTATVIFTLPKYKHTMFVHRDPQRELYYYQEDAGRLYISSIRESLIAIGGDDTNIHEFKDFEIVKIVKGKITKKWATTERKPVTFPKTTPARTVVLPPPSQKASKTDYFHTQDKTTKLAGATDGVQFKDLLYFNNGHKFTGKLWINSITNEYCRQELEGFIARWFIGGIMMKDEEAYNQVYEMCKNTQGEFEIIKFEHLETVKRCEYSMYPVMASKKLSVGTIIFPGKFHRTKWAVAKRTDMEFCPELSTRVYKIAHTGVLISEADIPGNAPVRERKLVETQPIKTILIAALETARHDNFPNLYQVIRYALKTKEDSSELYNEVVNTFLDLCEEQGKADKDYTRGLRNDKGAQVNRTNHEQLNTLLGIYYSTGDVYYNTEETASDFLQMLIDNNPWFQNQHFIDDFESGKYTDLPTLLADYGETDAEETVKPLIMAVAGELHRVGIIPLEELLLIHSKKAHDVLHSLSRSYEMFISLHDKKPDTCCSASPIDLLADLYHRAFHLKTHKLSETQQQELKHIYLQLQEILANTRIDEKKLKEKHRLSKAQIIAIYE